MDRWVYGCIAVVMIVCCVGLLVIAITGRDS